MLRSPVARVEGLRVLLLRGDDPGLLARDKNPEVRARVLASMGVSELLLRSERVPTDPGERLALYRLTFREDLERFSSEGVRVSPLQAMYRAPGPHLGPRLEPP